MKEHRTGIAEVTGSNPVEALIFFRFLLSSCLNWKIHCEDHSSLSSMTAVQIYELFHIYLHYINSVDHMLLALNIWDISHAHTIGQVIHNVFSQ